MNTLATVSLAFFMAFSPSTDEERIVALAADALAEASQSIVDVMPEVGAVPAHCDESRTSEFAQTEIDQRLERAVSVLHEIEAQGQALVAMGGDLSRLQYPLARIANNVAWAENALAVYRCEDDELAKITCTQAIPGSYICKYDTSGEKSTLKKKGCSCPAHYDHECICNGDHSTKD